MVVNGRVRKRGRRWGLTVELITSRCRASYLPQILIFESLDHVRHWAAAQHSHLAVASEASEAVKIGLFGLTTL